MVDDIQATEFCANATCLLYISIIYSVVRMGARGGTVPDQMLTCSAAAGSSGLDPELSIGS
jgi:hypothetical protein